MNKKIGIFAIVGSLFIGAILAQIANVYTLIEKQNQLILEQNKLISEYIEILSDLDKPKEEPTLFLLANTSSPQIYNSDYFEKMGVLYWNNYKWTWYSEKVLPGFGLRIPGRHADQNGFICDEEDYICVASSTLSKGTIVETPFGKMGKVYDCGCAEGVIDIYVNW